MKTNKKRFRVYEVDQDYINFLKGGGRFAYRLKNETDKQVYSHFGLDKENTNKYIGIIIQFNNIKFFIPITHDGNKNWFNRDDTCDVEKIYKNHNYIGSLLLCKAIPVNSISIHLFKFAKTNSLNKKYTDLCSIELGYLNQPHIHNKVKNKLWMCIDNQPSKIAHLRVNYDLAYKNSIRYQELIELEKQSSQVKSKDKKINHSK